MLILPAIDLYEGKAVRLYQGDYAQMTVYSDNPTDVASDFAAMGAEWVHMVDLEGAREGTTPNLELVRDVVRATHLHVEIGGGIRSMDTVARYLDAGVSRVILGTAAVTDPGFAAEAAAAYGWKMIALGVDLRDGAVAIRGWTERSALDALELCRRMQGIGIATVICTDISRDGVMGGANHALYRELAGQLHMNIIASGGVSSLEDVRALRALGIAGAIIGKAYYTGAIDLAEAIRVAK
ncbi:MAG: 1-(5-phosphoribosyl)-5-[Oscillospiraceae bacterium]|nr:1-(5-phosphoribosyl)-5-[(5-phosphoribosylamino)methylideneamino]imidazole-4-carboxamide isomerase [Oscillospiraceae bacterium]